MNEIDIVTRLRTRAPMDQSLRRLLVEAADAIETGRRWEMIARQAAPLVARLARVLNSVEAQEWLTAFRAVADRTPTKEN